MNILLLGYGKMGKTIEGLAIDRNHNILYKIDEFNRSELQNIKQGEVDVAIEFSQPEAAYENIKFCLNHGIPVVSGTTGWLHKKAEIDEYCKQKNGTCFYASNYSIGVNVFFRINEILAKMMNNYPEYNVKMEEIHHTEKKDAPSGTAITLAEGIIESLKRKDKWINTEETTENEIGITSLRIENVPGTHTINYYSDIDEIEIKHTAHSRKGFALGAVLVAEWIVGKKGVLNMRDFLNI